MADNSRIKIRMGPVEVEFEGSEKFLKDELLDMVKAVSNLYQEAGGKLQETDASASAGASAGGSHKGTTNQFAAKLGGSSGAKLIKAAGAKMHFADGKETFTRAELLKEAQSAKSYYKKSVNNNLTTTLTALVKNGTFNEPADNTYALTPATIKSVGTSLAK